VFAQNHKELIIQPAACPEAAKLLRGYSPNGESLQKCRMRTFRLMLIDVSNLSILHGPCVLVSKTKKGSRSPFLWISPVRSFRSSIFSHLPCTAWCAGQAAGLSNGVKLGRGRSISGGCFLSSLFISASRMEGRGK
jgi:hypothetical protein